MAEPCAYCEGPSMLACEACDRRMCHAHAPYGARGFCESCDAQWKAGDNRRTLVLALVLAAVLIPGLFLMRYAHSTASMMGLLMGPPVLVMRGTSWLMRRRFRPRGNVPHATARQR